MNVHRQPSEGSGRAASSAAIYKSVCRSCHGGCGVLLHVKDGRLVKVEGDRDSPLNHGRLCPIGTATVDIANHPARLKHPMRRRGTRGARSSSCKWASEFCKMTCYNNSIESRFRKSIPPKDQRNETSWNSITGEALKRVLDRKHTDTSRIRLMTRGEAFASAQDVYRVKDIALANPERLFWISLA